jgi:alpha-D-ribose 1-methylphosphonate 5-phosphate C-P lyase
MLKLFQKIINGMFVSTTSTPPITVDTKCAICGNMPDTLATIMLGNNMWLVCDTDKCKKNMLKQLIIEVI